MWENNYAPPSFSVLEYLPPMHITWKNELKDVFAKKWKLFIFSCKTCKGREILSVVITARRKVLKEDYLVVNYLSFSSK